MDNGTLRGTGYFACTNQVFDLPDVYQIAIYAYLCRRAGPDGASWPSLATISRDVKVSVSTVKTALRALAAAGWIERLPRTSPAGDHDSTVYILRVLPEARGVGRTAPNPLGVGRTAADVGRTAPTKDNPEKDNPQPLSLNLTDQDRETTEQQRVPAKDKTRKTTSTERVVFGEEGFVVVPEVMARWRRLFTAIDLPWAIREIHTYWKGRPRQAAQTRDWERRVYNRLVIKNERAMARHRPAAGQSATDRKAEIMRTIREEAKSSDG